MIVDSGGDLGTVLVGRQGAAIKRPAGFAFTACSFDGFLWAPIVLVSVLVSVDNQK